MDNISLGRMYFCQRVAGKEIEKWVRRLLAAEFAAWLDLQVERALMGISPETTPRTEKPGKKVYHVWYAKFPYCYRAWGIFARTLYTTHALLSTILAENLEDVFRQMQAEEWSPNGEARPLIEGLGLTHTSMMVGDIIEEAITHRLWVVEPMGFRFIGNNPIIKEPKF